MRAKSFTALVAACFLAAAPGFAAVVEHDYVEHDYYVPLVPGADNCYGAYRVLVSEGESTTTVYDGKFASAFSDVPPVPVHPRVFVSEERGVVRDDLTVLTDFALRAERREMRREIVGENEIVHEIVHRWFYETPYLLVGATAKVRPFSGISEGDGGSTFSETAMTRPLARSYFGGDVTPEEMALMMLPSFGGTSPDGKIIATKSSPNGFKHIFTLSDASPETIGWWRTLSQESMLQVDLARKSGYDVSYSLGSNVFENGMRKSAMKTTTPAKGIYLAATPFLDKNAADALWSRAAETLYASLEKRIPRPETKTVVLDSAGWGGWHSALSERAPLVVSADVVTGPIPEAVVSVPFVVRKPLAGLSPESKGGWTVSDLDTVIAVRSDASDVAALWPYAEAQVLLNDRRRSSVRILDGSGFQNPEKTGKMVAELGGARSLLQAGWVEPSKFTGVGEADVETTLNMPSGGFWDDVFSISPVERGQKAVDGNPWNTWAERDRELYAAVSPAFMTNLGLLFNGSMGAKGLFLDKSVERRFAPVVVFSDNFDENAAKTRTREDMMKNLASDAFANSTGETRAAVEAVLKSPVLKTLPSFSFSVRGTKHMSKVISGIVVKSIPVRYDDAVSSIRSVPKLKNALDAGVLSLPDRTVHAEKEAYFPSRGTALVPEEWR